MKSLRLLTQRIWQWQQTFVSGSALKLLFHQLHKQTIQWTPARWQSVQLSLQARLFELLIQPNRLKRKKEVTNQGKRLALLAITILMLTSTIGYRFYNEPQLGVDTIAPQTLRAPASAKVIDTKTTEANRKAARVAAVPVLMIDQATNQAIYQSLQRLLDRGNELRNQAGAFPFIETVLLSTSTQQYLRQAEEWDWRIALAAIDGVGVTPAPPGPTASTENSATKASLQVAILELQNYRRAGSIEDFSALTEVIVRARQRYRTAVKSLSTVTPEESAFYDAGLLDLTDSQWKQTKVEVRAAVERILSQGVAPGLPPEVVEAAIRAHLNNRLSANALPTATRLLLAVIKPNLIKDLEQTKLRAEQAAQAVEPVVVEIRRGEVIVQGGKQINQEDFVLLDHFGLSLRRINIWGVLGFGGLVSAATVLFLMVQQRFRPNLQARDYCLILLLTLSVPLSIVLHLPSPNLPAIGLLMGSFYGSVLGVTTMGLLSLVLPIGMEITWTNFLASAAGGLLGAGMAGQLRSREELAMLGGGVGLTQGVVHLLLSLILSTASSSVWYVAFSIAALQGLMGLTWSVVALGLSPYLERLFDLVTPIRLAELSNPNRPMLKRLAAEAPGTFQHTLFVATLAEAAACALKCNVELVRAGTLYHDIGKMHDPLGFIENQMGGPNKHDEIDNPWQSAAIIKRHVTEGLVMARKCRLPKALQAFIPEHQGTMPISYFYHQALERSREHPDLVIDEAAFRYDGPVPQSRETGIVMLADSCEAALRSLKDATPEEALAMVNRILRARWQDNQMVDSGLSRAEMTTIAEIFVQVWQQFNHQRIPYPKAVFSHAASKD